MLTERAVPVCGHLGLTPQSEIFSVATKSRGAAMKRPIDCQRCISLRSCWGTTAGTGVRAVELAKRITEALAIPVIGIGEATSLTGKSS